MSQRLRAVMPADNLAIIPEPLRSHRRWVVWKLVSKEGQEKPTKLPFYVNGDPRGTERGDGKVVKSFKLDSPEDIDRLATYSEAMAAYSASPGKWTGVGYALIDGDGVGAIDLDNCLDEAREFINADAVRVFEAAKAAGCYLEVSPSGRGVRGIGYSAGFKSIVASGLEAYGSRRFVTLTGDCLANPAGWGDIDPSIQIISTLAPRTARARTTVAGAGSTLLSALGSEIYVKPERVEDGERNSAMIAHVGHLRGSGMPEHLILDAAEDFNLRCVPPLKPEEVVDIVGRYSHQASSVAIAQADPIAWPELEGLPAWLPGPPTMDPAYLPASLRGFVVDVAERMQVPSELVATPLLISLGSVMGKKLAVQPKQFDQSWVEFPNLWGCAILEPGMLKSPVLNEASQFIRELDEAARRKHAAAMMIWDSDAQLRKIEQDEAEKRAKKEIAAGNRSQAQAILSQAASGPAPARERYIITDATPEARLQVLAANPNGVMLIRDELSGHIAQLRRDGYEQARAQELQLHDGKFDYEDDRLKRAGMFAEKPRMALYGNLQPSKAEQYIADQQRIDKGSDDGYLERLFQLAVMPSLPPKTSTVDRAADDIAKQTVRSVFSAAADLPLNRDGMSMAIKPRLLRFDPDAQILFDRTMSAIENWARNESNTDRLKSHIGKYRGTIAKLALIIAFAQDVRATAISLGALKRAIQLTLFYRCHAERIYASGAPSDVRSAHELLSHIKEGRIKDEFSVRDLQSRELKRLKTQGEIVGAISVLVECGYVREFQRSDTGGRPAAKYKINPRVTVSQKTDR
ncbi:MAG: DUF3987 domain-containing protein [Devosia sp.]